MKDKEIYYNKKITPEFNFIKLAFFIFLLAVAVFFAYATVPLLQPVIIAFIIAYILNPIVDFFERKQIARIWSILGILVFMLALVGISIYLIQEYFPSKDDLSGIKEKILASISEIELSLSRNEKLNFLEWTEIFAGFKENITSGTSLTEQLPGILKQVGAVSSLILIIPFCTVVFMLNSREMKKGFLNFVPNKYFEMTVVTISEVDKIFGNYIRGTLMESLIIGLITGVGYYVSGFPIGMSLIAGVIISGLTNAIPYVGPVIGLGFGAAIVILGIIPPDYQSIFGLKASLIGVVIANVVAQAADNVIVKPTVIGKSVDLHPLIVILGVMAGSSLFGFVGLIAAIPVIAIIKVVIGTLYRQLKGFGLLSDPMVSVVSRHTIESD